MYVCMNVCMYVCMYVIEDMNNIVILLAAYQLNYLPIHEGFSSK